VLGVRRIAVLFAALVIVAPAVAHGQTLTAMWDPSPASDNVTGYQVCIGTSSLSCNVELASVGASATSYQFSPPSGVMVYLAVRAVSASGTSNYSPEVTFSVPAFPQPSNRFSTIGTAITPFTLAVNDPDGSALTYSHTGLPIALSISQAGLISGTATTEGTYNVTIFASDNLATASASFVWTVTSASNADLTAPALSITSHSSGQTVTSSSVTISGTATDSGRGGTGIASVTVNGQSANGGSVLGDGTVNWSRSLTLASGGNTITVEARDGTGNVSMQQITLNRSGSIGPLTITGLTSNLASPQATGTTITFTATASGGQAPYQYKWWVFNGSTWTMVRDWSTTATYTWTPTQVNANYRVGIWARSATTTADTNAVNLSVPFTVIGATTSGSAPTLASDLRITGLTSDMASPQAVGTAVTFTASASGGQGPHQFKWWVFDGATWTMVRDWSTATTYTWTPTRANANYRVGIWARGATTTADVNNVNLSVPFVVTLASGLRITGLTSDLASPQAVGTAVTFTASASGGQGPYQYKWWVFNGSTWRMVRDWSTAATFTWTPRWANANYRVGIWVRDATTTADVNSVNLSVPFVSTP